MWVPPLGFSLKLSHLVLSAPLISSAPALLSTVRCRSFLMSPHDVLSTPPSASVSDQNAIGFLPIVVILIVCFLCFFFGCFSDFTCICLFFHVCSFYLVFYFFYFCSFISLYVSFLFLLIIRLYPFKLFSVHEYICIWSKPLGFGCEQYPGFRVEEKEYWLGDLCS